MDSFAATPQQTFEQYSFPICRSREPTQVEVFGRRAIDFGRLIRHQLPVLVDALEPERQPANTGFEKADAQLGEAGEDSADREVEDRLHGAERVRERMNAETRVEALDCEWDLPRSLPTTVRTHGDVEALRGFPHDVVARVVEVLLSNVGGSDHADEAVLRDAPLELFGRGRGLDHR